MARWTRFSCWLALLAVVSTPAVRSADAPKPAIDPTLVQAMKFRSIGPYRGGRVTAVAGVAHQPETFYMGSTGGGVWKTTDSGLTWNNVSDGFFGAGSIGAVAVAPSDPNVVYAGTGSACIRGNVSPGDGIYRSTDAGKTWIRAGLEDAGQIGRIRVHPENPDIVWVAVLGHAFGPSEQRGVFRSTDGSATWERVLYVADDAGAVDLALDPSNPRILFAAIWQTVRRPWELVSGGEHSGLYRSKDGGTTWDELTEGLPEGIKGRIGVTVSAARPSRVWALVEAEDGGLFRSDDGGDTFRRINENRELVQRAWYYTHVFADPGDENTVWVLNVGVWRSTDGGRSFEFVRALHGDHHALWINPDDPRIMINGNDGGADVSTNGGATWSTQANQPTAEFYRVTVDDRFPYHVYGAQQDNSTVEIPSRTTSGSISREDWHSVGGCESGHITVDPREPHAVYAGCYGGTITRWDPTTGQGRQIMAYPEFALARPPHDLRYRFQWNAPIRLSPQDPDVLYHTAQVVLRSRDAGHRWEAISPDLTRNDASKQDLSGGPITKDNTGVEVYGTIFAFEPSAREPGVLWAGSDDGMVHVSRDDGATWQDVTPEKLPQWATVNAIDVSSRADGRAYLAVTNYRLDDFRPYVYRTNDYGESWKLLTDGTNGIPDDHFVRVVREDPEQEGLLYAGTEFGLYASFDGGKRWQPMQLELPVTPVTDLTVKDGDLVVATQGRAFWILDDLSPLRRLAAGGAPEAPFVYPLLPVYRMPGGSPFEGGGGAAGRNPPSGAVLRYVLGGEAGSEVEDEVVLEILDARGDVLRRFSSEEEEYRAPVPWERFLPPEAGAKRKLEKKAGMNRAVWSLRLGDAHLQPGTVLWGQASGPRVPPGTYVARLTVGDRSASETFEVRADPRLDATTADLEAQYALARDVWRALAETHETLGRLRDVRDQVDALARRLDDAGAGEGLEDLAGAVREPLDEIEGELTQSRSQSSQDPLNFPSRLDAPLLALLGVVETGDGRPTEGSVERYRDLRAELDGYREKLDRVFRGELAAFNEAVASRAAGPVIVPR